MTDVPTIAPFLWFNGQAEEAARLYTSLFPDSRIDRVTRSAVDTSGAKTGEPLVVAFTLAGRPYLAMNGGAHDPFNDAVSLSVYCADQAEVDRLWDGLIADGGRPVQCGWLHDRFGLRWQIVPAMLPKLLDGPDRAGAKRAMEAMMRMVKLDIAALQRAFDGGG